VTLFLDLATRSFSDASGTALESISFKRRDTEPVTLQFLTNGVVTDLGSGATGILGVKPLGAYSSGYIASALSWTKSGTGASASYAFSLTLNTAEIDALFVSKSESGSLRAMLEVQWTVGSLVTSSVTLPTVIANDVIRGDEGVLAQANPAYPIAGDILTKSGNLSGISDAASARINLAVYSQSATDTAIAAHSSRTDNPHATTKGQVGLGNADNTSDAAKPVSTAQQTALDGKSNTSHTHVIANVTGLQTALDGKQASGSYATLDGGGKVPASQLPSYVDDVLEFATLSAFPATGESGKMYTALDTNKIYRWGGSVYVEISAAPGSTDAVPEGSGNLYFTSARALAAVTWTTLTGIPAWIGAATAYGKSLIAGADASAVKALLALVKGDIGLGSVDNTADSAKPISTATQTALDLKAAQTSLDTTNAAVALKRNIYSGTTAPSNGSPYSSGDFYFNTSTGLFYGPYTSGAWPSATSLIGPANSLAISSVTTNAGTAATASITGVAPSQFLSLGLPATTLSVGSVTTGAAGTSASATITGTAPTQTLALTIPRGSPGSGAAAVISSSSFTAATGTRYVTTATLTVSDPASATTGDNFEVLIGGGTATIGGVAYAPSRLEIVRYYNGSAWVTSPSVHSDNLTLNGTANTAPNQTAASGSSLMTRDLIARESFFSPQLTRIPCSLATTATSGGSASLPSGTLDIRSGTSTSVDTYARAVFGMSISNTENRMAVAFTANLILRGPNGLRVIIGGGSTATADVPAYRCWGVDFTGQTTGETSTLYAQLWYNDNASTSAPTYYSTPVATGTNFDYISNFILYSGPNSSGTANSRSLALFFNATNASRISSTPLIVWNHNVLINPSFQNISFVMFAKANVYALPAAATLYGQVTASRSDNLLLP